jgi:ankyrin repeat protein
MSSSARSFDRLKIVAPCEADWDSMIGNDQVRFCEHCNLQVNNLSGMTRAEAMRLVERSQGRLCVRFGQRANGEVLTRQLPKKLHHIGRRASRIAAGAFSATLSLSSTTAQTTKPDSSTHARIVSSANSQAEVGGSISGSITDPSGAVIPGAIVTLSNVTSHSYYIENTSDDGAYKFSLLAEGKYRLTVEAPTFANAEVGNIELKPEQKLTRNVELQIPTIVEQLEVRAEVSEVSVTMGMVSFATPEDPLARAAYKEDVDAVKQLVFVSLDINLRDNQSHMTALEHAVETGNLEIVRVLVRAGARADLRDDYGRTALMRMGEKATTDVVRELLSAGAKVNERDESGKSALMYAAESTSPEVVKELLDNGAKIDFKDEDGKTALMLAAANDDGDRQTAKMLIDAGAVVNDSDNAGKTPLMIAAEEGDVATVKLLLSFGAKVNERDNQGCTALMLVAGTSDDESVRELLNAGADLTVRNKDGKTALAIAREADRTETVKLLESRGAPE